MQDIRNDSKAFDFNEITQGFKEAGKTEYAK